MRHPILTGMVLKIEFSRGVKIEFPDGAIFKKEFFEVAPIVLDKFVRRIAPRREFGESNSQPSSPVFVFVH